MKPLEVRTLGLIESLESRQLLSGTVAQDVLLIDSPAATTFTTLATSTFSITKIKGEYDGHYTSSSNPVVGTDTVFFNIAHVTHTGHSSGSVTLNTHPFGKLTGTVTGVVKSTRHTTLEITGKYKGDTFTAEFKGVASHTGGSISGTYTISGGGVTDTGTFHIGKA